MIINLDSDMNHVKFISYTGKYPNLCRGILTLEIDGEKVKFGHDYSTFESWKNDGNYDEFWSSGGSITTDYCVCDGEWEINAESIPEQYRKYAREIDEVFNSNVPYGCCGGCI